jgi:membrane protein DedA with SNARE-associated domain
VIESLLTRFGYLAIFGLLLGAGVGIPFPEEPTQLATGVLVHQGYLMLVPAVVTCWLGIVVGDLVWFRLARKLGPAVLARRPVRRVLTPERRSKVEAHLARHAFWTVAAARHLSGLRLPVFALAATHGVRTRMFVLADGLSALVSVPVVVTLGYLGAEHLSRVRAELRHVELAVLAVAVIGALVVAVVRWVRARRMAT